MKGPGDTRLTGHLGDVLGGAKGTFREHRDGRCSTMDRTPRAKGGKSRGQETRCWLGSICTDLGPSPLWLMSALTGKVVNRDKSVPCSGGGQCLYQPESDSGPVKYG